MWVLSATDERRKSAAIAPPQVTAPETKPEIPRQPAPPSSSAPAPVAMLKDINFDFDKSNIRPADAEILRQKVAWFNANPGKKVKIEGNCDARGTIEYNLALGQKRRDSTKDILIKLGGAANLIVDRELRKGEPLCQEHNEECWAKNRRAHFVSIE